MKEQTNKQMVARQNTETEIPNPKYRNRKAENQNTEKQKAERQNTEWSKDRRTTIPKGQHAENPKYRMSEIPKNKNA